MTIKNIIQNKPNKVITINLDSSLKEAAILLNEMRIGALPVVNEQGSLVGIVSERDIVRICAGNIENPLSTSVKDAMTTKLEVAKPQDSVDMALARMSDRRIRHLPVMETGNLIAIISIGDLVKTKIDAVIAEANAMREYIGAS